MKKPQAPPKAERDDGFKPILANKRAFHDYEVLQKIECGLILVGTEVKSLREKNVSFADAFATVRDGELVLIGLNIAEYRLGNRLNHPPARPRKLLAHRREIAKLRSLVAQKGLTLIPLGLHWRRGKAKVELGVVRGKREFDKRETIRKRDDQRQRQRLLRGHRR
jgi:SsrA-binding protein